MPPCWIHKNNNKLEKKSFSTDQFAYCALHFQHVNCTVAYCYSTNCTVVSIYRANCTVASFYCANCTVECSYHANYTVECSYCANCTVACSYHANCTVASFYRVNCTVASFLLCKRHSSMFQRMVVDKPCIQNRLNTICFHIA